MTKWRWMGVMGVGGALLLPTVAAAVDQLIQFEPNTAIYAGEVNNNFASLRAAVATLETQVASLQETTQNVGTPSSLVLGPWKELAEEVTSTNNIRYFKAPTDGILYALPGGTGFKGVDVRVFVGSNMTFVEVNSCSNCARRAAGFDGNSITVPLRSGDEFAVTGAFDTEEPVIRLRWQSLTGADSVPTPLN